MAKKPKPPKTFETFVKRYPKIAEAWELVGRAGDDGPLDARTARLVKLGMAMGAMREGAVHASVRKAMQMGITREEIEQVVGMVAGTVGFPSAVAVYSWVQDVLAKR